MDVARAGTRATVIVSYSGTARPSIPICPVGNCNRLRRSSRAAPTDTGNSNASHMHFQLMDGPSALGSDGVPYVIDRFSYDGQVDPQAILDADDFLSGTFLGGQLPKPQPRRQQLPLQLAIVNFPL